MDIRHTPRHQIETDIACNAAHQDKLDLIQHYEVKHTDSRTESFDPQRVRMLPAVAEYIFPIVLPILMVLFMQVWPAVEVGTKVLMVILVVVMTYGTVRTIRDHRGHRVKMAERAFSRWEKSCEHHLNCQHKADSQTQEIERRGSFLVSIHHGRHLLEKLSLEELLLSACRWEALTKHMWRMRLFGWAGYTKKEGEVDNHYRHFGGELWSVGSEGESDADNRIIEEPYRSQTIQGVSLLTGMADALIEKTRGRTDG